MSEAVLCIGSNLAGVEARKAIARACNLMEACCTIEAGSDVYVVDEPYHNKVVRVSTDAACDVLELYTKAVEKALGRRKEMKDQGCVPIDIDIVIFDGEVRRPRDYAKPYFICGYRSILS